MAETAREGMGSQGAGSVLAPAVLIGITVVAVYGGCERDYVCNWLAD